MASSRAIRYVLVGVLGFVLGGAGGVLAAGTIPGPGGVITACYTVQGKDAGNAQDKGNNKEDSARGGQLRLVVSPDECGKNERAITWNQVGPIGPVGATGAKGDTGIGSVGLTGSTGTVPLLVSETTRMSA